MIKEQLATKCSSYGVQEVRGSNGPWYVEGGRFVGGVDGLVYGVLSRSPYGGGEGGEYVVGGDGGWP